MNVRRLILLEIMHRKLGFALAVATIAASVAALVAVAGLLGSHDLQTTRMLDEMNAEIDAFAAQVYSTVHRSNSRGAAEHK